MTILNAGGIKRSVRVTDIVVILSIVSLLAFVVIGLPHAQASNFSPFAPGGIGGILRATGLLFFAYTGYSRIATLVEEVRNPSRTIPIATITALGTAVVLFDNDMFLNTNFFRVLLHPHVKLRPFNNHFLDFNEYIIGD